MKRTFVDTGVLIAAVRGQEPIATSAREILDDPDREFVASVFLKLEVLPNTTAAVIRKLVNWRKYHARGSDHMAVQLGANHSYRFSPIR